MSTTTHLYIPDAVPTPEAYARCSHLAIGAHPDDLEFMAYHGISTCYEQSEAWFGGIVCTDGAGSSRDGPFANHSDEEIVVCRQAEQCQAADLGQYSFVELLNYTSKEAKNSDSQNPLVEALETRLIQSQPEILYTHNPADKHETHVAIMIATLAACRRLPPHARPRRLYGCEIWRDLDWVNDDEKVALDTSAYPELAKKLYACFQSQIAGGKNYDQAITGRQTAHATFQKAHCPDTITRLTYALDLTPLLEDDTLELHDYLSAIITRFKESVLLSIAAINT
jgi:LmbE family N-acetylglucosaminyl deacetylase